MRSLVVNLLACAGILGIGLIVAHYIGKAIDRVDQQLIAARRRFYSSADE